MNKDGILAAVNAAGGNDTFQVQPGDNAVVVVCERNDLRIVLTIPYEVHELSFEMEHHVSGRKIQDWFDYYGETEESDFEDDLKRFIFVLRKCEFRIDDLGKTVEYYHQDRWQYLFGYFFSDKYLDTSDIDET
jgi:hypothetical protein